MSKPTIHPDKITSPIQLMAAWFVMLILLSGVLLTAAIQIKEPKWAAGYLVICTSILVLIVLLSVILMLTRFRPNLQDGQEYSEWLKGQNKYSSGVVKQSSESGQINSLKEIFQKSVLSQSSSNESENKLLNSIYTVLVTNLNGAEAICKLMEKIGVTSKVYRENEQDSSTAFNDHKGIWLGDKLPTKLSLTLIKLTMKVWPHLEYIHLSTDGGGPEEVDWEFYIGGSTDTAENRYKLKSWTIDEINGINENLSVAEFHQVIRSKYP